MNLAQNEKVTNEFNKSRKGNEALNKRFPALCTHLQDRARLLTEASDARECWVAMLGSGLTCFSWFTFESSASDSYSTKDRE